MTDDVPKITIEAKNAFAAAFEGAGGLAKFIAWAKTHRTDFYTMYAKLISQPPMVQVNNTVNVEADREQLETDMVNALVRIREARTHYYEQAGLVQLNGITYRKQDDGSLVPTDDVPDIPVGIIIDNSSAEESPAKAQPAALLTESPAPPRSVPRLVNPDKPNVAPALLSPTFVKSSEHAVGGCAGAVNESNAWSGKRRPIDPFGGT